MGYEESVIQGKIDELQYELRKADYISDKLIAAVVGYIVSGDNSEVLAMYEEYKTVLEQRKMYRAQINELERQLTALRSQQ